MKTYDWIIETADSKVRRAVWTIIKILIKGIGIDLPVFPRSVINRCPAIILAVNRIARVKGRIIFLIVSMHTIKGINNPGVPSELNGLVF